MKKQKITPEQLSKNTNANTELNEYKSDIATAQVISNTDVASIDVITASDELSTAINQAETIEQIINSSSDELSTTINKAETIEQTIDSNSDELSTTINQADTIEQTIDSSSDELSTTINQAEIIEQTIEGYVENIDVLGIHGWVINHKREKITLGILINNIQYVITPLWYLREDVAANMGADFIEAGFTIKINKELYPKVLAACDNNQPIHIIANGIPLISRTNNFKLAISAINYEAIIETKIIDESHNSKPALSNNHKPLTGKTKSEGKSKSKGIKKIAIKPKTISSLNFKTLRKLLIKVTVIGYVEHVNNLEIYGWVIEKNKEPLNLSLIIDELSYPISPKWHERRDVASSFGNKFSQSGFSFLIPEEAVDAFLLASTQPIKIKKPNSSLSELNIIISANDVALIDKGVVPLLNTELLPELSFQALQAINHNNGIDITIEDFQQLLTAQVQRPIAVSDSNKINSYYYIELAKHELIAQRIETGRSLLKLSLAFMPQTEAFELLGNSYIEAKDYETASAYYEQAVSAYKSGKAAKASNWLFRNLITCKQAHVPPQLIIEAILKGIENHPEQTDLLANLDSALNDYWLKHAGLLEIYAVLNQREQLIEKTNAITDFIYNSYLRVYSVSSNPDKVQRCNLQRILIVGDFHIEQCVHYRIQQKVEQLKAAGKKVTTVSWTELGQQQNTLAFHDVVIFYRVPAEPLVLKAMAQVNAMRKLSFYEIDDLLFDSDYPPALESYAGYLTLSTYHQLVKGMASFRAATRYCRYGIGSTQPLADKLQPLVFGGRCFVHRNGLDSLNSFKFKNHSNNKDSIDIFYGSGTMAHNSDFIELALPALDKILAEYPQANLLIAGYLKLPSAFLKRYPTQVRFIPAVKRIKAYWSSLKRADINLAVLHDDVINGCKSELKWFEAACLGIPSVLSSTANYRDVIEDGVDGLLASNPEQWYCQLKRLLDNAQLRNNLAYNAQARAKKQYSINALSTQLCDSLEQALSYAQDNYAPKRQKIALVNVYFSPQAIGGATRVLADNFDVLQRDYADQFELSVFTTDAEHQHNIAPYSMNLYNYQGVRVYRTSAVWQQHMEWHPRDEKMGALFSQYLEAEQPDLIHFHCVQRLTGSVLEAASEANIPYIVTVHDAWWISDYQFLIDADNNVYPQGHPESYQNYIPPAGISMNQSIERIQHLKSLLNEARHVLTVSQSFADIYRQNEVEHILVNKNGISDCLNWQPKDTRYTAKVVCGHIGGMTEHKGYFLLQSAIEALQPINIELLIVDHSQNEGYRYKTLWGIVPVTFIGRVSQTHVVELYQRIDVLLAPSLWPESYGLVTREAAACACWVVASNMGGIGEDIIDGQSGFVIEPSVKALSDCLKHIDKNPNKFKSPAPSLPLRKATAQIQELTNIYRTMKHD